MDLSAFEEVVEYDWHSATIYIGNIDRSKKSRSGFKIGSLRLSENRKEYWYHAPHGQDFEIIIDKESPVGQKLARMVNFGSDKAIELYMRKLAFRNLSYKFVSKMISQMLKESYERGQNEKAFEIRQALGIQDAHYFSPRYE